VSKRYYSVCKGSHEERIRVELETNWHRLVSNSNPLSSVGWCVVVYSAREKGASASAATENEARGNEANGRAPHLLKIMCSKKPSDDFRLVRLSST